jgi:hypothetical protein
MKEERSLCAQPARGHWKNKLWDHRFQNFIFPFPPEFYFLGTMSFPPLQIIYLVPSLFGHLFIKNLAQV